MNRMIGRLDLMILTPW